MTLPICPDALRKSFRIGETGKKLLLLIAIGIAVRIILWPLSFDFDLSFFVITKTGFESNHLLYEMGNFYYPPVYGYLLSVLTYFWNLLPVETGVLSEALVNADSVSDFSYVFVSSIPFACVYKIPLLLIDLASSLLIYAMIKEKTGDRKKAELGFALFFLSPLVIWSSSVAAMFDSLSAFFMIFSIYAVTKKQNALSGAMLSLAFLTKVYPMIIGFPIVLYIISVNGEKRKTALKNLASFFTGLIVTAFAILLPLLLNEGLGALGFLRNRLQGTSSDNGRESLLDFFLNPMPDKFIYAVPLILILAIVLSLLVFRKEGDHDKKLVTASAISVCAIFIWPSIPTHPVVAIAAISLIIAYCNSKEWIIPWVLFSVLYVVHHTVIFGNRILHSLAYYTSLFDLETLVRGYFEFLPTSWDIMFYTLLALFIPGIAAIAVSINHLRKNKAVQ